MNIYEKLACITSELSAVAKNLQVGEGRSSYKAVGEADVLAAVKPLEAKYKVYSYPVSRRITESDIITTKKTYNGQESESSKVFMRVETVYRFVNIEKPDEFIEMTTYGDGWDAADKAPGKAMTYGDKYALLKAYKIITGDDPDQHFSEDSKITSNNPEKHTSKNPPQDPPKDQPKAPPQKVDILCICSNCNKEIERVPRRDGSTWSVDDIVMYSNSRFKRQLCWPCQQKEMKAGK